ncbi:MAG: tRNA (adenosine(37)-N6)-threonylcarbamoyltransferase complex ATPase subunit type 1 TsaE [Gammaproteobacteria bacterium]|nr:tRNA (adenosine(37)-N6)-threonylcarbamoyltransferase complex ATPase subunit type 1 TsaE [Gammaproteobacteria bacterium]MDH5594200.1 tRNA (adenosine(37)-N6)-threonylcarbamoyltransferase complex ATPase subunit type 1 TsaE [Gammaproteobacteria bacterium]
MQLFIPNETEMEQLGARLASHCAAGCLIFLQGELGTGKTTLTRGFLQAMGHNGNVKSPTYTLVEPYELNGKQAYHFDLYRMGDPEELEYLGGRDYFMDDHICLVEWPERGEGFLPEPDIRILIDYQNEGRQLDITANTERGRAILPQLA